MYKFHIELDRQDEPNNSGVKFVSDTLPFGNVLVLLRKNNFYTQNSLSQRDGLHLFWEIYVMGG